MQVSFTLAAGQNILASQKDPVTGAPIPVVRGLVENDVVLVAQDSGASPPAGALRDLGSPPTLGSPPAEQPFVIGEYSTTRSRRRSWCSIRRPATRRGSSLPVTSPASPAIPLSSLSPAPAPRVKR